MAQKVSYTTEDSVTIVRLLANAPANDPLYVARQFLDRPYVAHTLETFPDDEHLVINTRELDCTTFVESVVALRLCIARGEKTFDDYVRQLRALRYRDGKQDGYTSRLHYFSDWIIDNTRMGYVEEVQKQQEPFTAVQTIRPSYMSSHPDAYISLARHPEWVKVIREQERALNGRYYRYIPKSKTGQYRQLRNVIKDGDILALTTSKPGLEIAHLGFAVWREDGLHLLNASSVHKKVIEEPLTFHEYQKKRPSQTGTRVVRVKSVEKK